MNGNVNNLAQELHLSDLHGLLRSLHCGYTSLRTTEGPHIVDELNLVHLQLEHLAMLELVAEHRDVHNRQTPLRLPQPPTPSKIQSLKIPGVWVSHNLK